MFYSQGLINSWTSSCLRSRRARRSTGGRDARTGSSRTTQSTSPCFTTPISSSRRCTRRSWKDGSPCSARSTFCGEFIFIYEFIFIFPWAIGLTYCFVYSLRTEDVFHSDASVRKTQLRLALEHLELDDITETMLDEMDACDAECRPDDAAMASKWPADDIQPKTRKR